MSEPTPNVDLLRRTLAHIEEHPEEWKQSEWRSVWRCGSAACFAGHAAALDGGIWEDDWSDEMLAVEDDDPRYVSRFAGEPATVAVEYRARRILGLTPDEADDLFDGENTLDDLRRIVAVLTGGGEVRDA